MFISTTIGKGFAASENDVRNTRKLYNTIGYDAGEEEFGYTDTKLETTIRRFQRDNNLKEDGIMHPKGETENALIQKVSDIQREDLPPPARKRIPGTNIPDKGLPEELTGKKQHSDPYNIKKQKDIKPYSGIIIEPPKRLIDPQIEMHPNDIRRKSKGWDI